MRIDGRLRLPVLAASLAAIVARHETLRTTPDGPRQLVPRPPRRH